MQTVHLASTNPHKLAEFQRLVGRYFRLQPSSFPSSYHPWKEDGLSFMDNAIKKAVLYSLGCSGWVLADDSGLSVAALGGEPGVYSARYAGSQATDADNRRLLLDRLANTPEEGRTAAFHCALAVACQGKLMAIAEASCPGTITHLPRGAKGFGYDPIFLPHGASSTFAEMAPEEKDDHSHRARAVARLLASLPAEAWS
ncbi:non-canonical purine NTP pyrophosphatase [Methylacidimicrobium sp. B4]|uniref:non-canonical purine NTP pyrophosphatase n=1 Tax=Methylacidimicrobium sp. B4 TaxID=2796139 RepID=UPI001A8C7232|nr:non-canonical purine NTP pyrophosphatase [Methylacidimicrobium sp. B4]QSR85071.1 non-canonical purine NTP pyrophosphatase [Methylacidimicrobium sp. B4]